MKRRKMILATIGLLMTGGIGVEAHEMVTMLPEMVVTATRTVNSRDKVPTAMEVITEEDIKRSGAHDLRSLLAHETSVQVERDKRGGFEVMIRGVDSDKTLLLVDGRRLINEADAKGLGNKKALERINLGDVERIEIVKGPSSALYGSDAIGGVIHIITKKSKKKSIDVGLSRSNDDLENRYHFDTGRIGKWDATLDVWLDKTYRHMPEGETETNHYGISRDYDVNLNYHIDDNRYFGFYYQKFAKNTTQEEWEDGTEIGHKTYHYNKNNYGIDYNASIKNGHWQIRAYGGTFDWDDKKIGNGLPFVNKNKNTLKAFDGHVTVDVLPGQRVTVGAEYIENKVEGTHLGKNGKNPKPLTVKVIDPRTGKETTQVISGKTISEQEIFTKAVYVQDEITEGKWFIVPALRYDHHSAYGGRLSPKLGVTFSANKNVRVKINYGEGFKAPNVCQLYYDMQPAVRHPLMKGNPDLKPETSKNFDVAVEMSRDTWYTSLSYYDNRIDNLIITQPLAGRPPVLQCQNVEKARVRGVEYAVGSHIGKNWEIQADIRWMDAKNLTENTKIPFRPEWVQTFRVMYDSHNETGLTAMLWTDRVINYTYNIKRRGPIFTADYDTWNFTMSRTFDGNTRVYATVENIFDHKNENCQLDGRFWSIGIDHRF